MVEKQEIQDVLEVYKRNMAFILGDKSEQVKIIETCQMLADEVEDHEAEWEKTEVITGQPIEHWQTTRCSGCGLWVTVPFKGVYFHYDYCPNCGAKIKSVKHITFKDGEDK